MIANLTSVFPAIVDGLINSSFEFHLTGSRFFGGIKPESDWDFFVEESEEVIRFLDSIGFEEDFQSAYECSNVTAVYYGYCRHQGRSVKVDVQLVNDAKLKLEVQQALQSCFPSGFADFSKDTVRAIWMAAFEVAKRK